ncbi:MAG: hypothetical protein PUA61_07060 [Succinatimonas hippei]|nr:hypothetical protein [Succinatimonas hippei]
MLESFDPDQWLDDYEKSPSGATRRGRMMASSLKSVLAKAKDKGIPLGLDYGSHYTLEEAYLERQRFIAKVCGRLDLEKTITTLAGLMLLSMVLILWVLL